MLEKVHDVKLEFFKMLKGTINTYTVKNGVNANSAYGYDLIPDYRGSASGSGHIL